MKDSDMAVLEESDAAKIEERLHNTAHNPLPILYHKIFTRSGSTEGLQRIVVYVGAGVGPATWCSATSVTRDIISGLWS